MELPKIIFLWLDLETTGLLYEEDVILEMAYQFTDYLGEPLTNVTSTLTVNYTDDELMTKVYDKYRSGNDYVRKMHLSNSLWSDILFQPDVPRADFYTALEELHEALDMVRSPGYEIRFAGSSVGFDKRFVETVYGSELPISHRVHDLSTMRPFFKWQGIDMDEFTKHLTDGTHRAGADIERDIAQWRGVISVFNESGEQRAPA